MKKYMETLSANDEVRSALEAELQGMEEAERKERIRKSAQAFGIELMDADLESEIEEVADNELDAVAGGAMCVGPYGGSGGIAFESERGLDEEVRCACTMTGIGRSE